MTSTPLRIGMLTDLYKPHISGVTNHIALTKRFLEAAGHEVAVFTFGGEEYSDDEPNVFRSPGLPLSDTGYSLGLRYPWRVRQNLERMDILHAHHPFVSGRLGLRYARPLGQPVIFTNHTRYDLYAQYYVPLMPEPLTQAFLQAYFPSFCRECAMVISPSHSVAQVLRGFGVTSPIEVLPNGVDLEPLRQALPSDLRRQLGIGLNDVLGVYVGRLGPEKNLAFLLRAVRGAAAAWPGLHLVLIGSGPERENLEAQVADARLTGRVHFLGGIPYEEMPAHLAAADFFVTASITEVHPLTIIESMAAGLPAVGIHSPGIDDMIEHETNGLLAEDDLAELSAMMTRMAGDRDLRARLRRGARRTAEDYDIRRTVDLLQEAYARVVRDARPRRPGPLARWWRRVRVRV
jgi:glycosyltransferase involved in cell wall biosynthesis